MSTALLPEISASAWMLVTSSLIAVRFDAIARLRSLREVRREQARVLGARRVDDQIGRGDALAQARVERHRPRPRLRAMSRTALPRGAQQRRRSSSDSGRSIRKTSEMRFCCFASTISASLHEHAAIALERHQKGVGAVGDVLDEPGGKAEKRAVVVDGVVEAAAAKQIRAGEDEIADRAVGELERAARLAAPRRTASTRSAHLRRRPRPRRASSACSAVFARARVRQPRVEHSMRPRDTNASRARRARRSCGSPTVRGCRRGSAAPRRSTRRRRSR